MNRPKASACETLATAIARGERAAIAEALNLLDDRRDTARERKPSKLVMSTTPSREMRVGFCLSEDTICSI